MNKISLSFITLLVSSCAVGPDYDPPESTRTSTFYRAEAEQIAASESQTSDQLFWKGFQDPVLAELIGQTLSDNFDLQAMVARYQGAAALLRNSRREQWPSLTAYGSASDQRLAEVERANLNSDQRELYEVGAALQWELDFFGRLARSTQADRAGFEATGADLQAAQVALVGQLASSYFELRGLQQQLKVVEQNVELQQSSLNIVSSRFEAGRGTAFDTFRARAQLDATRASIPDLKTAIQTNMYRIAVLTGSAPSALTEKLGHAVPLPQTLPQVPVNTEGEVLRRRPDIRAAERRVAAATARIGVATADLFPRFTLGGLIGSLAFTDSDLFTSDTEYRRITLGIDWTFLDTARVKARIDAADAGATAALAEYRQAVLLAMEETETWLVRYNNAYARVALLNSAEQSAGRAVEEARQRYKHGYIDYFELLSTELELTRARDSLVRSQTQQALAMVNVYRSLAGAPEGSTALTSIQSNSPI